MSNATDIFNGAISRVSTLLGGTYRQHENIFSTEDLSARSLENGYAVVLLAATEKSPQINALFMQRSLQVVVTHRTYASVDAGKVVTTLATVYDKEAEIINSIRCWEDKTIGLIKVLPSTESQIEQLSDGEDSFIVNTLTFDILYQN